MKISQYPQDSSPSTSDYLLGNQASGPGTMRFLISTLLTFFWTLANIPTGATSPITRDADLTLPYLLPNTGVWTADSVGTNRNASMTAATVYINGRRITISAVTARTFTASKDTYVDVLDNSDGTGTLVYTETNNNIASPILAANSIRIAIIVTGATTIATTGSINQGQETALLPITSSIPYAVTDSLGNLIACHDPSTRRVIGFRQITANFTTTSTSAVQITGLTAPVVLPSVGRKVEVDVHIGQLQVSAAPKQASVTIWDGTVGSGTQLNATGKLWSTANVNDLADAQAFTTPSATQKTYNAGLVSDGGGGVTATLAASSTVPAFIRIRLA